MELKWNLVQSNEEARCVSVGKMNCGEGEVVGVKQEFGDSRKSRSSSSSSSQWSLSHKNPRIVRVSRNFGGKDRHSKVCTVRGLRDRRIRLSVPTAVQLYELQEKLGLSQPSKVIDWLLDAAKADIDNLPPLPTIPGFFPNHNPNHSSDSSHSITHHQEGFAPQNFFPFPPFFQFDNPNLSQFGPPTYNNPLPPANIQGQHESQNLNPNNSHLYFCPNTIPPFPSYLPPSMDQNLGFSTALHLMSSPARPFAFKPNPNKLDE